MNEDNTRFHLSVLEFNYHASGYEVSFIFNYLRRSFDYNLVHWAY